MPSLQISDEAFKNTSIDAVLTADIVVNEDVLTADGKLNGNDFREWIPIGEDDHWPYEGTFDGQGHTISGLYLDDEYYDFGGLFGNTNAKCEIKNIGIIDSYLYGDSYAGGICGLNYGIISNCYSASAISTESYTNYGAGGICGCNYGTISNCYSTGVIGTSGSKGGICGINKSSSTVENCYYLQGTCAQGIGSGSGEATEKTSTQFAIGEVAWLLNGSAAGESPAWRQTLGADNYPLLDTHHGIVYYGYESCDLTYSNNPLSKKPLHPGYDSNGFCTQCGAYQPAEQDTDGYYKIGNAGQLYWFANRVNNDKKEDINGKLTADIVVNKNVLDVDGNLNGYGAGFRVWTPICNKLAWGFYSGTFDGQGHTISGLYINDDSNNYGGLFGKTSSSCKIKNLGIIDSYFYTNIYAGGICALNYGNISNCYSTSTISIKSDKNSYAGGICGNNQGNISNCYSTGLIALSGTIGGICGINENSSTIENCYYLHGTCDQGVGSGEGVATEKTSTQFESGEVAWLLNGGTAEGELAWRQTLGSDAYPVPDASHGIVYHGYDDCVLTYSNNPLSETPEAHPGTYDSNGFCTKCGKGYQPAEQDTDGYYKIGNAGQLYWFAEQVNDYYQGYINGKLTANIVVNQNVLDADGNLNSNTEDFRVWKPIGDYSPYRATFDGQGYTVSGLYNEWNAGLHLGFFGFALNAEIKNVGIVDSYFYASRYVGGVCGFNSGNSKITNCYNAGAVGASDPNSYSYVGGVCGFNMGSINNCYNKGIINASSSIGYYGGVCGYNNGGSIANCYNIGTIGMSGGEYGSVCGYNSAVASISNCYYLDGDAEVGVKQDDSGNAETTVKTDNQFASGEVAWLLNGSTAEGDLAWRQTLGTDNYPVLDITHCVVYCGYKDCMLSYSNTPLPLTIDHNFENGFCTKCKEYQPAEQDESDGYYMIGNAGQLYWFAEQVNDYYQGYINGKLTANIVVNQNVLDADGNLNSNTEDFRVWKPIGDYSPYRATFDGQGYTVSGLYNEWNAGLHLGFFGFALNAEIKNVGIVDSYFYASRYVGGVCGFNSGNSKITNCYNAGAVGASDPNSDSYVGGVCGFNMGSINNCYNKGIINASSSIGYYGGVCGYNNGGSIANGYNIGTIGMSGGEYGSVCGYNSAVASISNCYYLDGDAEVGVKQDDSGNAETTVKTDNQFASGEVAWLLNGSAASESPAWRQTLGTDNYPVLDTQHGIVVKTTNKSLNSIIRPTAGTIEDATAVYNFAGIKGTSVYGIEYTEPLLAANHPYIFTTDKTYVNFVPADEEVTDDTETCGLTGVLEADGKMVYGKDNTAGADVSIVFTASALRYANPNGNLVKYGKCYIDAKQGIISTVSDMASKIAPAFEDGVDGLENVTIDSNAEGETYNLQGIPVGNNYKGFIIQNGQKLLRR